MKNSKNLMIARAKDSDLADAIADRLEALINKLPFWAKFFVGRLLDELKEVIDTLRERV